MATSLRAAASRPALSPDKKAASAANINFHWSMRLMSLVSLLALALYSYVLRLCRHQSRRAADIANLSAVSEQRRIRFAAFAFALDLIISAYFGAATPVLLDKGGLAFDRKRMPRPLFWFFAVTGFVPTASMALTVIGGQRWHNQIKNHAGWRAFHGITGLIAYFSWWIACAPVFFMAILGEERTLQLLKQSGLLDYMTTSTD